MQGFTTAFMAGVSKPRKQLYEMNMTEAHLSFPVKAWSGEANGKPQLVQKEVASRQRSENTRGGHQRSGSRNQVWVPDLRMSQTSMSNIEQ